MTAQPNLKVFVSYSRADDAFAQELVSGLEFDGGFEIFIDQHDIHEGELWKDRLRSLIIAADTIVFVVTPDSVASTICYWEIEEAVLHSKRIVPVLARPVEQQNVPDEISELSYVRFDGDRSFMLGLHSLRRALNVDLDWLREHTRLLERATEWENSGRVSNRMLSGDDVRSAKSWLEARPMNVPEPTDLHREYIRASELAEAERDAEERRRLEEIETAQAAQATALADREIAVRKLSRRTTVGLAASGALTLLSSGLAYWGYDAEKRFQREQELAAEEARRRGASRTDIAGHVVAFAASPGQLASDGAEGSNSPYTASILAALANPNTSFQSALSLTNFEVLKSSAGNQRPFYSTDMNGEIYPLRQPLSRKRKALTISVDQLGSSKFANVERDAISWERFLVGAGFEVERIRNPNKAQLLSSLQELRFPATRKKGEINGFVHKTSVGSGKRLVPRKGFAVKQEETASNTLTILFYAGIGISVGGENYIAPSGMTFEDVRDVAKNAVPMKDVIRMLRASAAASVMVLDTGFWTPSSR